jgi:hypothetical protein
MHESNLGCPHCRVFPSPDTFKAYLRLPYVYPTPIPVLALILKLLRSPRIDSASLCSMGGWCDNTIPTRCLATMVCLIFNIEYGMWPFFVILAVLPIRDVYPGSRFPDPEFYPSRIPDPKSATIERGEKKSDVILFYVATNLTKLHIILVLKC